MLEIEKKEYNRLQQMGISRIILKPTIKYHCRLIRVLS